MARNALAARQLNQTPKNFQKSGFARAIRTDQHRALAPLHFEVEVFVNHMLAVGLLHTLQRNGPLTTPRRLGETEMNGRLVGLRSLDPLHAGELLNAVLGLRGLAGFGTEAIDETLQMRDLALLVAIRGKMLLLAGLFLLQARIVVSVVADEFAVTNFDNPLADEIQKFPVVRNRQNRTGISREMVLKPSKGFEIEVVGRFVQQQQIRLLDEQPRQVRPHDPAATQLAKWPVEVPLAKCESGKNPLRHRLRAPVGLRPGGKFHHRVRAH